MTAPLSRLLSDLGLPTVPDGDAAIAERLRHAFGDRACEVAEKWAREQDRRYWRVVARLRESEGGR